MKYFLNLILTLFLSIGLLTAQHLKSNGTPDRRYKENKATYSAPARSSSTYSQPTYNTSGNTGSHLKKDGTPDKRYKANKSSATQPSYSNSKSSVSRSNKNYLAKRDSHGKIVRSESAKREFMKKSGYSKGRKGYVVDHIIPLKKGGCDCPENMQWQTIQEGKVKDKWE